jgi:hypothetical protein
MADYGTNAGFLVYHAARGNVVSQFNDDTKITAARLVASEWLDGKYRGLFPGTKIGGRAQVREWPRYSAYDVYGDVIPSEAVPNEIDSAVYEATYKQLTTPGSLNVDWTPPKYKRASVDGAVSVEYVTFANAADTQTRFAVIDAILSPILTGGGIGSTSALSGPSGRVG